MLVYVIVVTRKRPLTDRQLSMILGWGDVELSLLQATPHTQLIVLRRERPMRSRMVFEVARLGTFKIIRVAGGAVGVEL